MADFVKNLVEITSLSWSELLAYFTASWLVIITANAIARMTPTPVDDRWTSKAKRWFIRGLKAIGAWAPVKDRVDDTTP